MKLVEVFSRVVRRPASVFSKLALAAVWRVGCKEVSAETGLVKAGQLRSDGSLDYDAAWRWEEHRGLEICFE